MPRYKLTVAYDGTDFCGWQKQEPANVDGLPASKIVGQFERDGETRFHLRTVQHVLERAVTEIVRERINLKGSSRTDTGVHAQGQVAAFTCSGDEPPSPPVPTPDAAPVPRGAGWPLSRGTDRLLLAINSRLPDDVLVLAAEPTHPHFDPTGDAVAKGYSYTFNASRERSLWDRRYVHHIWESLDVAAMQAAAAHFVGEHDFAAFASAGHGRLTTVRTIFACEVTRTATDRIRIDVSGSGFLWNMVRIIAGTLVEVGRGRKNPEDIPRIIASADRTLAGPTLAPTGLCLEWIRFDSSPDPTR